MSFQMYRLFAIGMAIGAGAASAATITLTPTNFGFARPTGSVNAGNHAVGWYGGENVEIRQYLVFDRSAVQGTITAATLRLGSSGSSYLSPNAQETWQLFDVTTPVATLVAGTGGASAFDDLGGGIGLGSRSVNVATNSSLVTLDLNADGVLYLNQKSGAFAIGGALTSLTKTTGVTEAMFNSTAGSSFTRELVLTYTPTGETAVPEPGTRWILGAGLLALLVKRSRFAR
jgi:hypothetical protein